MVQLRYRNKNGDETKQVSVSEAREVIGKEIDKGCIVYDEKERTMITKATLGKVKQDSQIDVTPLVKGG